jgi:hypothetical protein
MSVTTLVIILVAVLVLGGGGYYYRTNPGAPVGYGLGGLVITILVIWLLLRLLHIA